MRTTAIVFALCAVACAVAHVAILRSVVRTASDRTPVEPGVPRPSFAIELAWAVVPMLALALVLTATWTKVRRDPAPQPEAILEVAR
jgi:uncharacterized membrane protein